MTVGSTRGEISEMCTGGRERDESVSYLVIGENRRLIVEMKHREKKTYQTGRTDPARQVCCRKDEPTPDVLTGGR